MLSLLIRLPVLIDMILEFSFYSTVLEAKNISAELIKSKKWWLNKFHFRASNMIN
jgi:hypothetical protein